MWRADAAVSYHIAATCRLPYTPHFRPALPLGLKDVIPDSAGKVGGVIKDMLPLPGFLKGSK